MSDTPGIADTLKRPRVLLAVAAALVIVLVWLLAFFLPQGSRLSTLEAQKQALAQKVALGNAKVAHLEHTFKEAPKLTAMATQLKNDVPATTDIYNYIDSLSATVTAAHMKLTSVVPGGIAATSGPTYSEVLVTIAVKGSYDHLLTLVADLYDLPRLTDIQSLQVTGGGPSTNRTSTLSANIGLAAFTTAKPASQP